MRFSILLIGSVFCCGCGTAPTPVTGVVAVVPQEPPQVKAGASDRVKVTREGHDWPRFMGPNGDFTSPEKNLITNWPKEGLKKIWECDMGIGYPPPVVAAGRLFHFDRFGNNNRLSCRNAETGELVWIAETPTAYEDMYGYDPGPRCCPVVEGDKVFTYGPEGDLVAWDFKTGKELWKVVTRTAYRVHQNFFGVGSTPVVEGKALIVAVGGSPAGPRPGDFADYKGNGSCIVAFDMSTGKELWKCSDELASYTSPTVVTLKGQRVGLYFCRSGLIGFDPVKGKELFRYPWRARVLESVNAANPVVVGDRILLTESYEKGTVLLEYDGKTVKKIWADTDANKDEPAMMAHWCTPIAVNGFAYGCSARHTNDGELRCFDLKTGDVAWRLRRTLRCTLIYADGHFLSLSEIGELRLFKANDKKYEEVARWECPELDNPAWAPPVLSRGLLYIRGKNKLICYELKK